MNKKISATSKEAIVKRFGDSQKYWMTENEYTGILIGKESTNSEYVISDGIIAPDGFVPDHYHKWEDQTLDVISGKIEAKVGDKTVHLSAGDSIHCPRGTSHFIKNTGNTEVRLISYIFPGDWAKDFMAETSAEE